MGPVRLIASLAVTAGLCALFGRRRSDDGGEVSAPTPNPSPPSPPHGAEAAAAAAVAPADREAGGPGPETRTVNETSPDHGSRPPKPVPHPIRPWELWHPAAEPVHLFRNDPEERVSWNDMTDGDDPAIDGDAWVQPDLEPEGADSGDDRFAFGRLRPFTGTVMDAPELTEPAPSPPDAGATEPEASVAVALPPTSVTDEVASPTDEEGVGDVLFRDLVSPDRMTASEQALEDQAQESSGGLLINGPVSRRTDRDQDRSRRRLPVGLRVVGGEAEGATDR